MTPTGSGRGICVSGRSRDLWRKPRRGPAHRYPCRIGVSCRRPRAEGQARSALSISRLFDAREAQSRPARPSLPSTRPTRPKSIGALSPSPAKPTAALRSAVEGEPVEWAVEMRRFDETRTLDHVAGEIDEALADALGRAVAAAHDKAPSVDAAPWIDGAWRLHR